MTDDDLMKRRRMADEDLQAYLAGRPTTIGSNADAVRMFHGHILSMRQAGASWEEVAAKLESWSGRKIAPATVKQYMTDINKRRMSLDLSSTARVPQPAAPAVKPPDTQKNSRTETGTADSGANDREGTDFGLGLSDGSPLPGSFNPKPADKWKRNI